MVNLTGILEFSGCLKMVFGGRQLYFIASALATLRSNSDFHGILARHILAMGVYSSRRLEAV
jgi:hypothetical protein